MNNNIYPKSIRNYKIDFTNLYYNNNYILHDIKINNDVDLLNVKSDVIYNLNFVCEKNLNYFNVLVDNVKQNNKNVIENIKHVLYNCNKFYIYENEEVHKCEFKFLLKQILTDFNSIKDSELFRLFCNSVLLYNNYNTITLWDEVNENTNIKISDIDYIYYKYKYLFTFDPEYIIYNINTIKTNDFKLYNTIYLNNHIIGIEIFDKLNYLKELNFDKIAVNQVLGLIKCNNLYLKKNNVSMFNTILNMKNSKLFLAFIKKFKKELYGDLVKYNNINNTIFIIKQFGVIVYFQLIDLIYDILSMDIETYNKITDYLCNIIKLKDFENIEKVLNVILLKKQINKKDFYNNIYNNLDNKYKLFYKFTKKLN